MYIQNITQKTKDWTTPTPVKPRWRRKGNQSPSLKCGWIMSYPTEFIISINVKFYVYLILSTIVKIFIYVKFYVYFA